MRCYRKIDGFVKSPSAVLRFIFRHCGARLSAPHSKRFARLASGAFYCAVSSRGFYETIKIVLTGFVSVFLVFGCASHEISEFNHDTIKTITGWRLSLTDEMAIYEKALDREELDKTKSKKSVLLKCDIKLRDDIAYYLTSKHKINLVKELKPTIGLIRLDAECRWQHYITLNIMIYDWKQNRLAKIAVSNGEDVLVKDDEKFAEYCADVIAKVIRSQ